ncbi:bifunctional ADP-dependent NAD(P)H-hydrate dehydratase/NAD(P)H-hydrate epimerase [Candidatus Symbiobacter mobilis]|uniref:Bifunctional NAD(P)H-hydrate repair enzyme n=1 Tax=Candidatus Symbiobacter mobilis CR TaxID=946483 RepID=U5N870_9BURK|nr:bifunctional ADP-dependent NAD(P)H-hydrate dehydratase/NAD(P)H-hydrate epimerase [Candidatus Symbiobacter mobilis]AGX86354.1 sugar kinase [Candidatus Symbiobacter mobilis CR]
MFPAGVHHSLPLYDVAATREIERRALDALPPHTLMRRAGLAVARLALAIAPHAQTFWIACGAGNNGGDGMEAATHLRAWGKDVVLTLLPHTRPLPADAQAALEHARSCGLAFAAAPPADFDVAIDGLLGIGARAIEPESALAPCIYALYGGHRPVLAIDVPSGLDANTGSCTAVCVRATHTLSLLTLKPGLFTGQGRDHAGQVWFDDLGVQAAHAEGISPCAQLAVPMPQSPRQHASHKGSFGDVLVIGGAAGMTGAAWLAATAALYNGAGRVIVGLLDPHATPASAPLPDLMVRPIDALMDMATDTAGQSATQRCIVCGCGGGEAIAALLERLLCTSTPLVLDADALRALAVSSTLQDAVRHRTQCGAHTVLTPHPREAALLLATTTAAVQSDRIACANALAQRLRCTVVLKGSGTLVAHPGHTPALLAVGNPRLAIAGTGDVLAGMIGARLAGSLAPYDAAIQAVHHHGTTADRWPADRPLTASALACTAPCATS